MPLRRLLPSVCAAAAVLALAACSGSPAPDATPSTSPSATASTVVPTTSSAPTATPTPSTSAGAAEQRYLGFVQQFSPTLATMSPATLLTLGRQVCAGFRAGEDAGEVAVDLGRSSAAPDLQATDGAVILGAAVATICPQYRDRLQSDASASPSTGSAG